MENTQETLSIERSIWIAAPRERVWQAFAANIRLTQ